MNVRLIFDNRTKALNGYVYPKSILLKNTQLVYKVTFTNNQFMVLNTSKITLICDPCQMALFTISRSNIFLMIVQQISCTNIINPNNHV